MLLIRHADSRTLLEDDNASPGTQKTAKYSFGAKKKELAPRSTDAID